MIIKIKTKFVNNNYKNRYENIKNSIKLVPSYDNNEDYYIVKSVDSQKICDEIRKNNFSFTS